MRPGDGARYPVEWFVGREAEADRLTASILGHSGSLALEPLKPAELLRLLERRYRALALDPATPVRPPVSPRAVTTLYAMFNGDLRGTLAALDEAAHGVLGYGRRPDATLTLADMQLFLRHRYEADARARLTGSQAEILQTLVARMGGKRFSIKEAAAALGNERSRTARNISELQRAGYVLLLDQRASGEERGRPAALYELGGAARLAFSKD